MILILTKEKHPDNTVECQVTVAAEGVHDCGMLRFPNQITWTRFLGALQRGQVGMRDLEVRLDVKDPNAKPEEVTDETRSVSK